MLEVDVASFTSGAGVQDEVPLAHQGKLLGVAGQVAAPCPATGYPHPSTCIHSAALWDLPWYHHAHCMQDSPSVGALCPSGALCTSYA